MQMKNKKPFLYNHRLDAMPSEHILNYFHALVLSSLLSSPETHFTILTDLTVRIGPNISAPSSICLHVLLYTTLYKLE